MTSPAQPTPRQAESPSAHAHRRRPLLVRAAAPSASVGHAEFRAARLPWYGLDAGWRGERRLGALCVHSDGTVQYGTLLHGDPPACRPGGDQQRRAVTVVTMAPMPRRPVLRADGGERGFVEASTVASVAAVAGIGLVEDQRPWQLDAMVRQQWMEQQRELALQLTDRLGEPPWQLLVLSVDLLPQVFHYRESEYGWVLATATKHCFLAAYGRGVSAYSLAFTQADLGDYSITRSTAPR